MKNRFLTTDNIESRANDLLQSYFSYTGTSPSFPIPIDRIVELYLDVPVLWEPIVARGNRPIASLIHPPSRNKRCSIVMNEDFRSTLFVECPGLERTALAHEVGHHQLHIDHAEQYQLALDFSSESALAALVTHPNVLIEGIDPESAQRVLEMKGMSDEEWWREWQAHTFMRYLLMPRALLEPILQDATFFSWSGPGGLYDLRDRFGVTISALVRHLTKLGYIQIDSGHVISNSQGLRQRRQGRFNI